MQVLYKKYSKQSSSTTEERSHHQYTGRGITNESQNTGAARSKNTACDTQLITKQLIENAMNDEASPLSLRAGLVLEVMQDGESLVDLDGQ